MFTVRRMFEINKWVFKERKRGNQEKKIMYRNTDHVVFTEVKWWGWWFSH